MDNASDCAGGVGAVAAGSELRLHHREPQLAVFVPHRIRTDVWSVTTIARIVLEY